MANTTKGQGLLDSQVHREKYWEELKDSEKIERLRTLLKSMVSENYRLREELLIVKQHTHNEKGEAVSVKRLVEHYPNGANVLAKSESGKEYI